MLARVLDHEAPPGALLDAGCGRGTTSHLLAAAGREIFACDLIARWPRGADPLPAPIVRWLRADALHLPFPAGTFAGIAAGEVLEHLDDDLGAVAEWARVLAPGGVLAVTVPAGPDRMNAFDRRIGHRRRYSRRQLAGTLMAAGLTVESINGWGWPVGRLYDRFVQRPALGSRRLRQRFEAARSLRWSPIQAMFAFEGRWDSRDAGSGLVAVCRKEAAGYQAPTRRR